MSVRGKSRNVYLGDKVIAMFEATLRCEAAKQLQPAPVLVMSGRR